MSQCTLNNSPASLKYVGKLPLAVLAVALRWELGNRASIPVGFAASAAFDKVFKAGKHGRAAAAVAEPGKKIHSKQSVQLGFLLFVLNYL